MGVALKFVLEIFICRVTPPLQVGGEEHSLALSHSVKSEVGTQSFKIFSSQKSCAGIMLFDRLKTFKWLGKVNDNV